MKEILDNFNDFFKGEARAEIKKNAFEITINSKTLVIQLPYVSGIQSMDSLPKS